MSLGNSMVSDFFGDLDPRTLLGVSGLATPQLTGGRRRR